MQLTYISIQYYRSITEAYKLDLSELTVLLGKNNMGKTNIIKAIKLGMDILNNMEILHRRKKISKQFYDWTEDFPIILQNSRKLKNKKTAIRMDFTLDEGEMSEFSETIHSSNNGNLSIYIELGEENSIKVTVPKKGKNASAMTNKIVEISAFICNRFGVQYIPAVRSENDAYRSIVDLVDDELISIQDEKYQEALEYIDKVQKECLESLAIKVKKPLVTFLPEIKSIDLYKALDERHVLPSYRRRVEIDIDDGVCTSLSNKGDGVKSLFTIAMLSQLSNNGQRLIIVDEPENHLHPEAVHYIDGVLQRISRNHQVLISTHNPIFVNRNSIASNLIVDGGHVTKARKIEDIRKTLGVVCSDNLMGADYMLIVEGISDKEVITKCMQEDEVLNDHLKNKSLVIQDTGGTHSLQSIGYLVQQLCCNYLFLLDYDNAGRGAANSLISTLSIPKERIRYFMKVNKKETELEDMYETGLYRDYLLKKGVSIDTDAFKNRSVKWSDRISKAYTEAGMEFNKGIEDELKKEISHNLFVSPVEKCLTNEGNTIIKNVLETIKRELNYMNERDS